MNGQVKMNPKSPLNLGAWRSEMISVISSATVLIRKIKCRRLSGLSGVPTWARSCTKWSAGIDRKYYNCYLYHLCPQIKPSYYNTEHVDEWWPLPSHRSCPEGRKPHRVEGTRGTSTPTFALIALQASAVQMCPVQWLCRLYYVVFTKLTLNLT